MVNDHEQPAPGSTIEDAIQCGIVQVHDFAVDL